MTIDDKYEDQELAEELANGSEKTAQDIILISQLAGVLWFSLPIWFSSTAAGAAAVNAGLTAVNVAWTQLTNKRFYARLKEVRDAMNARLQEVDESKINKGWLQSEEGQTLLFETIRQAVATSNRDKIKMLGTALANGRVTDFSSEERKELFLQLIRDLSPQHIVMLRRLMPNQESAWRPKIEGKGQDLLVLQMLYASGLVTESLEHNRGKARLQRYGSGTLSSSNALRAAKELEAIIKDLQTHPRRIFTLSTLGKDFIEFVGLRRVD